VEQERRVYQRLALTKPLTARFGRFRVHLLDVSAIGALIESDKDIPLGSQDTLRFKWRHYSVEIKAEAVRTAEDHAGLHFLEDSEQLRNLIAESALEVLKAQEANLEGARERNIISGDETLTTASAGLRASGFVSWTLEEQGWKKRRSLLPDQPDNGFTVSAGEPEDEVALLRKTYENGDAEARRLTRLLAELSAATVISRS
jgi:PilZ domain-containing protein